MIGSFRNRALKRFWERNDSRRLPADQIVRIKQILRLMQDSSVVQDLDIPGLHFHRLTGDMKGRYAVTVRANWRITFGWDGEEAIDVDHEDYH